MKFMMVSKAGEGGGLLYKIKEEDNDVRMFIEEPGYRTCWKGIIQQTDLNDPWIDRDTVIIFDSSGMGKLADSLRKVGYLVFGGSHWADKLEEDRKFGLEAMDQCRISFPETEFFNSNDWDKAKEFVMCNSKDRWVFKPSGDLPSRLTYLPSDCDDLMGYMDHVKEHFSKDIKSFCLQKFVDGKIVSTEMWCDGTKFVGRPNHTVEVKKLMNDDLGPATGCAGNMVWLGDESEISVDEGISRIEDQCVKNKFIGTIDLNAIISDDIVYGLEWTPRFGLDAMPTFLQMLSMDVGEVISSFAKESGILKVRDTFAGGVRLSIPPYPLEPKHVKDVKLVSPNQGLPIRGLKEANKNNIYFYEIMLNKKQELIHSEGTGAILVASDTGATPEKSLELPYKIVEGVQVADKQYRTDLKTVLPKMYNEVKGL